MGGSEKGKGIKKKTQRHRKEHGDHQRKRGMAKVEERKEVK